MIENKLKKWCSSFVILLLLLAGITSCNSDDDDAGSPTIEGPRLTSSKVIQVRTAANIITLFDLAEVDIDLEQIIYDVQIWRITYQTLYGDQEVTASGLVFIPVTEEQVPFVSYQHGTVANNTGVPSQGNLDDGENLLLAALSATGFVSVASDYIGFGSSLDIVHPYYVEQPTRDAVMDMLRASLELANENEVPVSSRLYLMGYSQGGYATMTAHKGIEEKGLEFFELQASFPSSGAYDVMGMRDYFLSLETYHQPFYLAYVAEAYKNYYGWDASATSLIFKEPYASIIPDVFDGSLSGGDINKLLTENLSEYLTAEFRSDPDSETFDFVNEKFEENSLLDWTPSSPMYMFHGDVDITVPYQNSVDTHTRLLANGATNVTLTSVAGDHGSGAFPYILEVLDKLRVLEGR